MNSTPPIDAFLAYHESEDRIATINAGLEATGLHTHFWRTDIKIGELADEAPQLRASRNVVVFLGSKGWGPNHRRIVESAVAQAKRILPVLIGDPPKEALDEVGGLFRRIRYLDWRAEDPAKLTELTELIRAPAAASNAFINRIIRALVDGSEEDRQDSLEQIAGDRVHPALDRDALAERLRSEITGSFSPGSENKYASAVRDPKRIASSRSWMLSALTMLDAASQATSEVVLKHVDPSYEPDRSVRYWVLASLYFEKAECLGPALEMAKTDAADEVADLARAIERPDQALLASFRERLRAETFEGVWAVLRILRVVPIPELAPQVCEQLERTAEGTPLAYDVFYALASPPMARAAAPVLAQTPGLARVLDLLLAAANTSSQPSSKRLIYLLAAFDRQAVVAELRRLRRNPEVAAVAGRLQNGLVQLDAGSASSGYQIAGYASDSVGEQPDELGIAQDVHTLTAIMVAREVSPPLAIGLFGPWGSGKSFFMREMRRRVRELAARPSTGASSTYCTQVVQIEFNAWHYVDTNLWASLVTFILQRLAAHVSPTMTPEQQRAALLLDLSSARETTAAAVAEKQRVADSLVVEEERLGKLRVQRQDKEIQLKDLRVSDLATLLTQDPAAKQQVDQALEGLGLPKAMSGLQDFRKAANEAYTLKGRTASLVSAIATQKNAPLFFVLVVAALFGIPLLAWAIHSWTSLNAATVAITAFVGQITAIFAAATSSIRKGIEVVKSNLDKVEQAKQAVEKLYEAKRSQPTAEEVKLHAEVEQLKISEQQAEARLTAATGRVVEIEQRLRALQEGTSLARFLSERTGSDDYRKHLGLISTVRQDFEALADRLSARASLNTGQQSVDRIILYIDDLDRCPANKVVDVLQAVHLLLAYPLFVVVVGVDPRWLLHSLAAQFQEFKGDASRFTANPSEWMTTPQHYLEKIIQVPYNLRAMSPAGYGKLVEGLLLPSNAGQGGRTAATPGTAIAALPGSGQSAVIATPAPASVSPTGSAAASQQPAGPSLPQMTSRPTETEVHHPSDGTKAGPFAKRLVDSGTTFEVAEDALVIQSWEATYATTLYALIPSPRAAKRLVNVYRILKARVPLSDLPRFEGSEGFPGTFQVPMLLLAVVIHSPRWAAKHFPSLLVDLPNFDSVATGLLTAASRESAEDEFSGLAGALQALVGESTFPADVDLLRQWLPHVARYSFDMNQLSRMAEA
jgi:KAP family P-loop domain